MPEFLGLPCVELKNEALSLLVTESVGPRILSLRIHGGENLFAEVPDMTLDCPGAGKCHLRGGHRFWVAPEEPRTTYRPDDRPVKIRSIKRGLEATQPIDETTGLQKSFWIVFEGPGSDPVVSVHHSLRNCGTAPVTCAPWAITQLKPGGFAILPMTRFGETETLLPNRSVALWPYTDMRSPHITWGNKYTFVHANMKVGALKLGIANPPSTLAYFREGTLFIKSGISQPDATYCDNGCSGECYCNDRFLELETLGPLVTIPPGGLVTHMEAWTVVDQVRLEPTEEAVESLKVPEFGKGR
jgi:hypothetical protein